MLLVTLPITMTQNSSWIMAWTETGCIIWNAVHKRSVAALMHSVLTKGSYISVSQHIDSCVRTVDAKGLPHLSMLLMLVQFQQLADWPAL